MRVHPHMPLPRVSASEAPTACIGDYLSPKIRDVPQRRKLSTTIGADKPLLNRERGRAESVGVAVDKAVARRLHNPAALERQTAAYFKPISKMP